MQNVEEKIKALLAQYLSEDKLEGCFVVELKLHAHNKLDVFIDCDEGVSLETCRILSRYLEQDLDENKWLGEHYTLEVSSPGAKRPLELPRQYPKHIGRKLEVKTLDGETITGKLTEVTDENISLYFKERIKEGKRKKTIEVNREIAFDQIKQAKVKITF